MRNKIEYLKRGVEFILALANITPSITVILNPFLFIMFIPVGVYAILTWPWIILKDIPDPLRPGESLYWLTYAIMFDGENTFFPALNRWGLIDLFLLISGSIIFLASFIFWILNLRGGGGLITSGIYRFVRHPQYLGIILLSLGLTIRSLRPISFIAWITLLIGYLILASLEERSLFKAYGPRYKEYSKRTAFIVPFLRFNVPEWLSVKKPYRYMLFIALWFISVMIILVYMRNMVFALRGLRGNIPS